MTSKKIPIMIKDASGVTTSLPKQHLIKIFKSRIRTQRRSGNLNGGICFHPPLLDSLLKLVGDNVTYKQWLDATIQSIYFELETGKIVPIMSVDTLWLIETKAPSVPRGLISPPMSGSVIPPLTIPIPNKWYKVCVDYNENGVTYKMERVYLGDDLNLARGGMKDVTLDHVVPIRDVLTDYVHQLPWLSEISDIAQSVGYSATKVSKYIPYNIAPQISNELRIIVQKTRGIRICSGRVN